jgi:hypothetical protein
MVQGSFVGGLWDVNAGRFYGRLGSRLCAGAVDATMLRAGAAGEGEPFLQGVAGAMDANGGVAGGDVGGLRKGLQSAAAKVDTTKDVVVLRLQSRQDLFNTATDDVVGFLVGSRLGKEIQIDEILCPAVESAVFGGAVTVVVDNGIAQDAVEPGYGGLVVMQG